MNRTPDVELVLRDYFADDGLTAPDYVLDVVEERIGRQRQRRSWRLIWRFLMSPLLKYGAAAAAVLVIAIVGYSLLPRTSGPGVPTTAPTPSAQPTAAVTAAPSASANFPTWYTGESNGAGILAAGSQTTKSFVPRFTFTVPQGWVNSGDEFGFYGLFPDTPANQAEFTASGDLDQAIHMGPRKNPYFTCDAWEDNQGATAAEIVAAVAANNALATSKPVDVTIGGLTGKQIDVQLDPGWTDTCPGVPPTFDLGDIRSRGILLDTPDGGVIVIFLGSLHSAGHEAFLVEAMPIIESFQFALGQ